MDSDEDTPCGVGCPIRISRDQRSLASPPGFSQRATSFIASQCQGIHQMPFSSRLSTTPNDSPVISDQMISDQMKLPPIWQFSPLEDTSDTHRAHGSTRPRHSRASSRAPKPDMSRDRKACPPRSQLASSPFNQHAKPEPARGA